MSELHSNIPDNSTVLRKKALIALAKAKELEKERLNNNNYIWLKDSKNKTARLVKK